jgi:hypothetical protein
MFGHIGSIFVISSTVIGAIAQAAHSSTRRR